MARRSLPRIEPKHEGLGRPTIMDRGLAARHGTPYVHLAVFAIDIDRVHETGEPEPFGWEVFLVERYLLDRFDGQDEAQRALVEDVVLEILDGEGDALGAQLVFAVWDAIQRGAWPAASRSAFKSWRGRPDELVGAMASLWTDAATARTLADRCLSAAMEPPLAAPTRAALESLARP